MVGTYYIVPEKDEYKAKLKFWEEEAAADPSVVFGNHTMHHKGFKSVEHATSELEGCNAVIERLQPSPRPRLISYAAPGGVKNEVKKDELKPILERNRLVYRPEFNGHGAAVHYKTGEDILVALDKALEKGGAEWVIFHGVGGDWLNFGSKAFTTMLDGVELRRENLWITDAISYHKYVTERDSTKVEKLTSTSSEITFQLTSTTDSTLYDHPLTLICQVPASWSKVQVTQGERSNIIAAANGQLVCDALPNRGAVRLAPAK